MPPDRWSRIQELFASAVEIEPTERRRFLEQAAGSEPTVVDEVLALLRAHDAPNPRLGDNLLAPDEERWLGARVGAYRLLEVVGHGGMSSVFLGERADGEFDQRVAIKLIRSGLVSPGARDRFIAERQILAKLTHPNIARLLDGGLSEEGVPFFAMEFVQGEHIDSYCDRHRLSIRRRLRLFLQVSEAVQYAHSQLVIHRDIKASNVLVTRDGVPKLLDFGIAKILAADGDSAEDTGTSQRPMTPAFASPEQLLQLKLTTATDVYLLGGLLYRLLSGRPPVRVLDLPIDQLARAEAWENPPSLESQRRTDDNLKTERVSFIRDLDAILEKALRFSPADRYPSVEAFSQDLRNLLSSRPVTARQGGLLYTARRFVRRNRVPVGTAAALSALVLATAVAVGLLARESLHNARRELQSAKRAEEVATFLVEIFDATESGVPVAAARELIDRGVERVARNLSLDDELRADLLESLGRAYRRVGAYDPAEPILREALALREARLPENDPLLLRTRLELAWLAAQRAEYRDAEESVRSVLASLEGTPSSEPAEALQLLGFLLRIRGEFDEAEEMLRRAIRQGDSARQPDELELAKTHTELGKVFFAQERWEEAERELEIAIASPAWEGRRTSVAHAELIKVLGDVKDVQGDAAQAERLFDEALATQRKLLGDSHPEVAATLLRLGLLAHRTGRVVQARALLEEALEIRRRALGDTHPRIAESLNGVAQVLIQQGEIEAAVGHLSEAIRIMRLNFPDGTPMTAYPLHFLGRLQVRNGQPDAGIRALTEALDIRRRFLPPENPLRAHTAIELGIALVELGTPDRGREALEEGLGALGPGSPSSDPELVERAGELLARLKLAS